MSEERPPTARDTTPRAAIELPVAIQVAGWPEPRRGLTANVSATGMFLRYERPEPIGAMVRFELGAGAEPLAGMGEVVWIRVRWEGKGRPAGMGIRFLHLDPETAAALERKIEELQDGEEAAGPESPGARRAMPLIEPLRPPGAAAGDASPPAGSALPPNRRTRKIALLLAGAALLALLAALFLLGRI